MALPAILLLENEEPFSGQAVGVEGVARGIMVASTLGVGIPGLLTDPAYGGKMVCFTYPHVGTAGVVPEELQGDGVAVRAVVGREIGRLAANRLGVDAMDAWLARHGVPAMEGVDTRAVAGILARRGLVRAVMGTGRYADAELLAAELAAAPDAFRPDAVGVSRPEDWEGAAGNAGRRIVVCDLGVKRGFLRRLSELGCSIRLVPGKWSAGEILAENPDGVVFSGGTGTPRTRPDAVAAAAGLLGRVPLFGVGVGAGVLAAAAGARTTVDGRAHYGVHPVGRPGEASAEMTSQAHEFWIDRDSLADAGLTLTHFHLNDGSVEGYACGERRILGVLFNPEADPGPRDSLYVFDRFLGML